MVESNILWYSAVDILHNARGSHTKSFENKPGFTAFKHVIQFFNLQIAMVDRSNTITLPIKTKVLPFLELPKFKKTNTNFEELCLTRARFLLDKAVATNRQLAILYSGGIDSTLIMTSLLTVATEKELKNHIKVLLSHTSISENKNLFKEHILKKCNIESSFDFTHYLGNNKYIVVTGETGDQLFGSMAIKKMFVKYGKDFVFSSVTYEKVEKIFLDNVFPENVNLNEIEVSKCITPLFNIIKNSPIDIPTVYHFFWWLNFILKWQSVYTRTLAYINPKYEKTLLPEENYFAFFSDSSMQLWAMNNPDKLIKDDWKSYKYIAKEAIYNFDKNEDYLINKVKFGSLRDVFITRSPAKLIDETFTFHRKDISENIWNDVNSFV